MTHQLPITDEQYRDIYQLLAERTALTERMDAAAARPTAEAVELAEERADVDSLLADWMGDLFTALPEPPLPHTTEVLLRCECGYTASEHAFAVPGHLRCPECGRGEEHLSDVDVDESQMVALSPLAQRRLARLADELPELTAHQIVEIVLGAVDSVSVRELAG
ncbi:MAG: hypothetical protein KKB13_30075 [Chloroflexi bacterium]|nr:hypothetical protein [Chloroflexota bacterium]